MVRFTPTGLAEHCRGSKEGKRFFFEKKNQKTFAPGVHAARENGDSDKKVFCFFSSEKKAFFPMNGTQRDPTFAITGGWVALGQPLVSEIATNMRCL
jgi:hypothetical protein